MVATATRRPNNIYILDMKKREKTKATQNKDEILLSATGSGGAALKSRNIGKIVIARSGPE